MHHLTMNNATIFAQHPSNFQFLSVCHYINTLGIIFHNKHLIALEERNHSVSVLNTLFEYFHKSKNESETKFRLLQKVLKGSDLYGGGENERLDLKYVNETYQYIVSNALFSHHGYITGYLAEIINRADNVTYFALKHHVFQDLLENYTTSDYCSSENKSIKLTLVAIDKIFHDHIWPIFPEPEQDLSIVDVNYIYAMVGLKIARSLASDTSNLTFHDYMLLSRQIDLREHYENESYEVVLNLFSTPALFFFAYKKKATFREKNRTPPLNDEFWSEILENLFSYINSTVYRVVDETFSNNLHWKLEKEMQKIENRTFLATKIIRKCCEYFRHKDVPESLVALYKTLPDPLANFQFHRRCHLCRSFPDLDKVYDDQFSQVRKPYNELQKNLINKALTDGYLVGTLTSNVTVKQAKVPDFPSHCDHCTRSKMFTCTNCQGKPREMNSDIYLLFAIITSPNKTEFYALRRVKTNLVLYESSGLEPFFADMVANDSSLQMETEKNSKILKYSDGDYEAFIQTVADMKTEEFLTNLKEYHRDPTTGEKIFHFLKYLVPFYGCVESVRSGDKPEALLSCSLDILNLIPIAGVALEYSTKLTRSLLIKTSEIYLTAQISARAGIQLEMATLYQMSQAIARTVAGEILTTRVLEDLSIASLRACDPGFELSYQLSRLGFKTFQKTFQHLFTNLLRSSEKTKLLMTLESVFKDFNNIAKLEVDHNGLVPKVVDQKTNYEVVRYFYPGGEHYFGPTCVSSFGKTAELRSIEGNSFQVPVVSVKSSGGDSFRPYSPETGEISDIKLETGKNDLFRRIQFYVDLGGTEWNDMKFVRNYQVYHHTVHWEKKPTNDLPANSNPVAERPSPVDPDTSGTSRGNPDMSEISGGVEKPFTSGNDYISIHGQETYDKYFRALEQFEQNGFSGIRKDQETLETLRRSVEVLSVHQAMDVSRKLPENLWFKQTVRTSLIDRFLKKMKVDMFYFNDLTILTDIPPKEIVLKKRVTITLKTEIRYHLKLDDSQYGFVDLASFHDKFKYQFIVFPEVEFDILNSQFYNGKEILALELKPKSLAIEDWMKIRKREDILLDTREKVQSKRAESIENAAFDISLKTPLHRFTDSKKLLEEYILKIDDSLSSVPTYDMLAQDICADFTDIPDKYDEWKITKNIFNEDVLFQTNLHHVSDLESAEERLRKMFGEIDPKWVKALLNNYWKFPVIRHNVIFEDYFLIYAIFKDTLKPDVNIFERFEVLTRRLALRQCEEQGVKGAITLYKDDYLPNDLFKQMYQDHKIMTWKFKKTIPVFSNKEFAVRNGLSMSVSGKFVLFQLEIKNRAGIAEISHLADSGDIKFLLPEEIEFEVKGFTQKTIEGREVFVITLQDRDESTEKRIVKIVKKLNKLLSTETLFYAVGKEKLPLLLKENNFLLAADSYTPGSSGKSILNDNIKKKIFKQTSDYKKLFRKHLYPTVHQFLQEFEQSGLSAIKNDKLKLGMLRQSLETISYYQMMEVPYKLPLNLWCSQTIKNPLIVNYLKSLKGKEFYFNDITLSEEVPLGEMFPSSFPSISLNTEVRYHLKFDSHTGLVDLRSFHDDFSHKCIVFPDVVFYVKDTKFYNGRDVLVLELVKKPIEPQEWMKIRQRGTNLLKAREVIQSKRGEIIENLAFDVSLNSPLNKFTETEKLLREYILETDGITELVPDYHMLAKYISSGDEIPESYKSWKITNHKFIDDVLFNKELHQVKNLESATRRINIIFDYVYTQFIEPVFKVYQTSPTIRHYLTFEDYYVIYSHMVGNLMKDIHTSRRFEASIYRLALRQCGEDWIRNPITIYNALNVPVDDFETMIGQAGEMKTFHHTNPFFTREEFTKRLSANSVNPFKKTLIYKVNIKNQAGIVDFGRLNDVPNQQHILLGETELMIEGLSKEIIEGREYDVLTLHDLETVPKEARMVKMVNRLNELFSTDTKFYINVQEMKTYSLS